MVVSEVTQNCSVAICGKELWESLCRGWVLGAKLKAFPLGSAWLKSKSNPPLKKQEAEIWSKTNISAPERGSDTRFDTKWPFHLLCKLCACCWYQILIKRVKKRWLRSHLSGMNSPLSCAGTWASLPRYRVVGANTAASSARSSRWRGARPTPPSVMLERSLSLGLVRDECPVPLLLPKAEGSFLSCSSGFVFCWLKSGSGIVRVWYRMNIECASKIKSLFRSSLKYWPWKNFLLLISSFITVSGVGAGLEKAACSAATSLLLPWGNCWDQGWDKTFLSLELRKRQVLTWAVIC